jgi:hypothetical protein
VSDATDRPLDGSEEALTGSAALAVLFGAALAWTARSGAVQLLIAVAALQALLAFCWVYVLRVPGRHGAIVIAALAAGTVDVTTSVWPHSRLAAMLVVIGLAVPVMFVHQLLRGAARVRVGESFGAISILVVAECALPALVQLRHEFPGGTLGTDATFGVVVAATGALLAGCFTDMVVPVPRFDAEVARGLPAVLVSAAVGAALGHLTLHDSTAFGGGRAAFVGGAVGILAALLAVAVTFVGYRTPLAESGFARRSRPVLPVVLPLALVAPVAFLLCLAIRA